MTKPGMVIKPEAFGSLVCSLIGGMSKYYVARRGIKPGTPASSTEKPRQISKLQQLN